MKIDFFCSISQKTQKNYNNVKNNPLKALAIQLCIQFTGRLARQARNACYDTLTENTLLTLHTPTNGT